MTSDRSTPYNRPQPPSRQHPKPSPSPSPYSSRVSMQTQGYESFASRPINQTPSPRESKIGYGYMPADQVEHMSQGAQGQGYQGQGYQDQEQGYQEQGYQEQGYQEQGYQEQGYQEHPSPSPHFLQTQQGHGISPFTKKNTQQTSREHLQSEIRGSTSAPQVSRSSQHIQEHFHVNHHPKVTPSRTHFNEEERTAIIEKSQPSNAQFIRGKLTVIKGEQTGESWSLNREVSLIGRGLDNDIVLLDIATSRKHMKIVRHQSGFQIVDLQSANGVYLNYFRTLEDELYDGDEIELGETLLRYETLGTPRTRKKADDTSPGVDDLPESHFIGRERPQSPPSQYSHSQIDSHMESQQRDNMSYLMTMGVEDDYKSTWMTRSVQSIQDIFLFIQRELSGHQTKNKVFRVLLIIAALLLSVWLGRFLGHKNSVDVSKLTIAVNKALKFQNFTQAQYMLDQTKGNLDDEIRQKLTEQIQSERVIYEKFSHIQTLVKTNQWIDTLKRLKEIPSTHVLSQQIDPLRSTAERGLLQQRLADAKRNLLRGKLNTTREILDELDRWIPRAQQRGAEFVRYALWIHQSDEKVTQDVNPPPREQRALEQAAQLAIQGETKKARKILKNTMPQKGKRKALFKLRLSALVSRSKHNSRLRIARRGKNQALVLKYQSLAYLLGVTKDSEQMVQHYQNAIKKSIGKSHYAMVAPWLKAALTLNPIHPSLLSLKKQLVENAQTWLMLAKDAFKKGNTLRAKTLGEAARPFLSGEELNQVDQLLISL